MFNEAPTAKPMLWPTRAVKNIITQNNTTRNTSLGWSVKIYVITIYTVVHTNCIGISAKVMAT